MLPPPEPSDHASSRHRAYHHYRSKRCKLTLVPSTACRIRMVSRYLARRVILLATFFFLFFSFLFLFFSKPLLYQSVDYFRTTQVKLRATRKRVRLSPRNRPRATATRAPRRRRPRACEPRSAALGAHRASSRWRPVTKARAEPEASTLRRALTQSQLQCCVVGSSSLILRDTKVLKNAQRTPS
jgi:hypothetical protein